MLRGKDEDIVACAGSSEQHCLPVEFPSISASHEKLLNVSRLMWSTKSWVGSAASKKSLFRGSIVWLESGNEDGKANCVSLVGDIGLNMGSWVCRSSIVYCFWISG